MSSGWTELDWLAYYRERETAGQWERKWCIKKSYKMMITTTTCQSTYKNMILGYSLASRTRRDDDWALDDRHVVAKTTVRPAVSPPSSLPRPPSSHSFKPWLLLLLLLQVTHQRASWTYILYYDSYDRSMRSGQLRPVFGLFCQR